MTFTYEISFVLALIAVSRLFLRKDKTRTAAALDGYTYRLAGQWGNLVLADIDTCRDKDRSSRRTSMTTSLSTLGTDDIDTLVKGFLNMFRSSDHLASSAYQSSWRWIRGLTFMTKMPALWSFSTTSLGGTPTAQTNNLVFSSIITSIRSMSLPLV
jgi:hypothetical protein